MTLKRMVKDLRKSPEDFGLEALRDFCSKRSGVIHIGEVIARQEVSVVGEISSLRIVPRAGCPSLEATVNDGTGTIVASWTGRRQIAGVSPGRRLMVNGRANPSGPPGRFVLYNPHYELL